MLDKNIHLILDGPIVRMLWKLAVPNIIAWSTWTVSTFFDAYFVGYLGKESLAVIALVFPFQMLMLMMAGGAIGGGVTSSVGRSIGQKDFKKAESSCWHSILICLFMSFIYSVIFYLFSREIFLFMGASNRVLEDAILFSKIFFCFSILIWLVNILSAIIRGLGDTYTPAKAITIGSISQIILSGVLTFGFFEVSGFGVIGPSIAILLCHFGMAIYLIYYLVYVQSIIKIKVIKFSIKTFNDIMKVGGLGLLNSITIALTVAVVTGYVGNYGANALAGYGLGSRLELILTPIIFGLGAALTASVSINIGSKQINRARKITWIGGTVSFVLIGCIGLIVSIFPNIWIKNFSIDPIVCNYAINYLKIAGPFYCLFGLGQAIYFASQGTGKMIKPITVGIVRFFTVIILGYFVIYVKGPIDYIFYAVSLGLIITGLGMIICLLGPEWKENKSIKL